jgi:hypothetical protein
MIMQTTLKQENRLATCSSGLTRHLSRQSASILRHSAFNITRRTTIQRRDGLTLMRQSIPWLIAALIGTGLSATCMRSRESEVLLSRGMTLKPEWQEIHPGEGMRTTAQWSEVLVEVPGLRFGGGDHRPLLEDGSHVDIEGYLTTDEGRRVDLEKVSSVNYGGTTFVRLSASALEGRQQGERLRSVSLKSAKPLKVGKIVWFSYDPRDTKSGVAFPRTLG